MMKKIAIPIFKGKLSQHFGRAEKFIIYTIDDKTIVNELILEAPQHEPEILPNWLIEQKVTELIAGGVGQKANAIFKQHNINVLTGINLSDPNIVIQKYLDETLEPNVNLCDH